MLSGLSLQINEALNKGNIEEVKLKQAMLIVKESKQYPIACVLVATKSTRSLRNALNSFANSFFVEFSSLFSNTSNIDNFNSASKLVDIKFGFIPEYDK